MNDPSKKIRRRDCVKLSNKIIDRCRLPIPRVTSIDGIRSNLFTSLLQVLYHRLPEGIIEDPASTEDEVANVQAIVNHLALDLIHIDLSHISGADVIAGEPRAIYNLLEIFCGLHKYLSSTSIGKWNLEESLTETDSQLSSQPSSGESASDRELEDGSQDGGTAEDAPGGHQPWEGQQQPSPSVSRQSAAVGGSASGPQPAPRLSSAGPGLVRTASAGSAGRAAPGAAPSTAAAARVRSTPSGVGQVPSGASAGKVASAAGSAGRVPSAGGSAARAASSGPAGRVPSGSGPAVRASAVRVASSGSAGRVPSSGSAVRVPSGLPTTKVSSSVSGVGRVRSGGAASRQTSGSGPLPASSASAGGEAEASLLPSSESGPAPAARRSVSSGGGSGGAGAAGSSGAGAETAPSSRVGGKASRQAVQDTARSEAAESETSGDGPSPLRAPSGPGGEFAGLGRSSASRPSHGGLPADGGSSLQLTGSIDHHHYHHYDGEESGESSQPTEHTENTEEEQSYSSDTEEEEEAEEGEPDSEDQRADSPEEASPESELDPQQPWDHSEERQHYQQDTEDSAEEEEEGEEYSQGVDISRQISEEMELMRRSSSTVASVSALRVSPEQKRSVSAVKREPTDPKQVAGNSMGRTAGAGGRHGERPSRRQLSAPSRPECLQRRRRCDDHSSTSEPGLGRRPGARLPTTNVETVAEIRETGVERDVTETTREQAGDRLHKETVRREVRRKVSSAPHPRHMSCARQTTRRSVRSDGVGDWLESRVDDSRLRVDGGEADVFEYLRREFPYVHVSAETKRRLLSQYRNQMKYIMSLVEPVESRTIKIRRQEVLKRQALLTDIMRQQKAHDERFRHISDSKRREARIRNMPRDSKISCLRAQRYVSSFQQQFQSRSALNQSKEELLLRAVFEEMLEIQRSRLRSVRKLERQAIDQFYDANGYTSELNRLHQYYEANFRDLAELLSKERNDLTMAEKQQTRLNDRIRREFRDYMEADVRSLNDKIVNSWQPQFRELDADRVRSDLYRANWKFCVQ